MKTIYVVILVLLSSIIFLNAIPIESFVYDSEAIIEQNARLRNNNGWKQIWTRSYWGVKEPGGLYRPLTLSTFRIEYNILGFADNPNLYLISNILLHVSNVLLLFCLGILWLNNRIYAFLSASLFSVHPISTSVVPNLVGRADLLVVVCLLGALISWEKYSKSGNRFYLGLVFLIWSAGLLSKESAAVLPLVIVARDFCFMGSNKYFLRSRLGSYLGFVSVAFTWLAIRYAILGGLSGRVLIPPQNPLAYVPYSTRIFTAVKVLGYYLWNTVLPFSLSADYSFNQIRLISSILSIDFVVAFLVLSGILCLICFLVSKLSKLTIFLTYYLAGLLLVSNLFVTIGTIMAGRLLYVPLAGFCLFFGSLAGRITESLGSHSPGLLVLIPLSLNIYALSLGITTINRSSIWKNDMLFWSQTAKDSPRSTVSNYNFASTLLENRRSLFSKRKAFKYAAKAVSIAKDFPGPPPIYAYSTFGRASFELAQKLDKSRDQKRILLQGIRVLKEGIKKLNLSIKNGFTYDKKGPRGEKIWHLYHQMGVLQFEVGNDSRAKKYLSKAINHKGNATDHALLGKILLKSGDMIEAHKHLLTAVKKNPRKELFREWLSEYYGKTNQFEKAIELLESNYSRPLTKQEKKNILEFYEQWINHLRSEGQLEKSNQIVSRVKEKYNAKFN